MFSCERPAYGVHNRARARVDGCPGERTGIHEAARGGTGRSAASFPLHLQKLRMVTMRTELVKSMKNAPTMGTTRNARGAGP